MIDKSNGPSGKRTLKKCLCIAAGLLLIASVSIGIYVGSLMNQIHYVDSQTAPTLTQQELNSLQ
ncbi:MAG: hypothetical protein UHS47_12560, partial [Oscillospiraceae bacterium]|nr:hypothetical protein [Oscillospiraceae bacterium]